MFALGIALIFSGVIVLTTSTVKPSHGKAVPEEAEEVWIWGGGQLPTSLFHGGMNRESYSGDLNPQSNKA